MNTIRCPECNLVDWENAIVCKRCNYKFQPFEQNVVENNVSQDSFENQEQESHFEGDENFVQQDNLNADFQEQRTQFDETFDHFPTDQQNQNYQGQNYQQQNSQNQSYQQPPFNRQYQNNNSKPSIKVAVTSMVLGILSFPFIWVVWVAFFVGLLMAMFGVSGGIFAGVAGFSVIIISFIVGIVALFKAKKYPNEYGGKGFAITGILCSGFGIITIPLIAAIAIPAIFSARIAANENSALKNMRKLSVAETTFMAENGTGRCLDLDELGRMNMIDKILAKGEKSGYRYLIVKIPTERGGCEITATPVSTSTGNLSFFYSTEDSVLRAEKKNGEFADKNSPAFAEDKLLKPPRPQISENQ